jgi:hypothetical protein
VILDAGLARIYGVETKNLNKAVKRNAERFPPDFMFQLTSEEVSRFQFGTLKRGQNIKYLLTLVVSCVFSKRVSKLVGPET